MKHRLHTLYGKTFLLEKWFSSRFTLPGKNVLFLLCLGFLFGINVQQTMIYQIFAVSIGILLFSYLMTLRNSTVLRVTRFLPQTCVAGKELKYRVSIENRGKRREQGILFRESVRQHIPGRQEFVTSREEDEDKRNIFDRKMGYYRWLWLLKKGRMAWPDDHLLPEILPGRTREIEVSLLPERRGNVHIDGYILGRVDPFGLCKREVHRDSACNLLVLPKIYEVPLLFLGGSRRYHQGGLTVTHNRGESNEFFSLREYYPGDPVKHIDWKSTARTGKTIVRQNRDEYFSRYGLILDSFTVNRYSTVFEEAVSVAASILLSRNSAQSVLDLLFVEDECITCTIGSGLDGRQRMLEILASVSTCRDTSFAELAALVRSQASLLSGIIIVLIDIDEERQQLINYLLSHNIPTKALLLVENLERFEKNRGRIEPHIPVTIIEIEHIAEQLALL